jgi:hypothetical protein
MPAADATTISQMFAMAVAEYEHEPALRTPDGAMAWTWGEYGRAAAATAAGLADLGVGRHRAADDRLRRRGARRDGGLERTAHEGRSWSISPARTASAPPQPDRVLHDAGHPLEQADRVTAVADEDGEE